MAGAGIGRVIESIYSKARAARYCTSHAACVSRVGQGIPLFLERNKIVGGDVTLCLSAPTLGQCERLQPDLLVVKGIQ